MRIDKLIESHNQEKEYGELRRRSSLIKDIIFAEDSSSENHNFLIKGFKEKIILKYFNGLRKSNCRGCNDDVNHSTINLCSNTFLLSVAAPKRKKII